VSIGMVQVRDKVLSTARVHERVEPRQHQDAGRPRIPRLAVEQEDAERRLAPGVNGGVELRQQHRFELVLRGEDRLPNHRAAQRLAGTGGPVKAAPRERTSEA
jgi:hypothetical protein